MGEEGKIYNDNQRDIIYTEMLKPIKLKISQILLYDTESAMSFLQKYNDILKSVKEQEILSKITELEFEISEYERNAGKQKIFEYKSQSIIQQIKDLQIDGDRLSFEDFESEFRRIKQTYQNDLQMYSFEDRDAIEQQLYDLYGKVMLRKVREGSIEQSQVSKKDIMGLIIFMNKEIGKLSQSTNPIVQNAIERIKFLLMDGENAFQGDEIWKVLSYAQEQKYVEPHQALAERKQPPITALAVVNEKKPLLARIKKVFQKEPQLPLQVEDLSKITLDWLSQYIPEEMLAKIEEERLQEEGEKTSTRYMPDSKTAIYDFIGKTNESCIDEYEYEDKAGNKHIITFGKYGGMGVIPSYLDEKNRTRMRKGIDGLCGDFLISYAMFLDDIFGTNFANDLACDFGEFIQNPQKAFVSRFRENILSEWDGIGYNHRDFSAKSKLFKNLFKSYIRIAKECEKTENSFRSNEQVNRRTFYEKSRFREEMKQGIDNHTFNSIPKNIEEGKKEINQVEPDI